jgi:segregation and condensation protein B
MTRSEIEALRGVDCAASLQFLLEKKLVAFAGRRDSPGRPRLYATTPQFLDNFGLRSIDDLPSLAELAELNGGALDETPGNLFNRGAMKSAAAHSTSEDNANDKQETLPIEYSTEGA